MTNEETLNENQQDKFSVPTEKITIGLLQENLIVGKETVETGTVQFIKKVHSKEEDVKIDLTSTHVQVQKVPVNKIVDTAPEIRYEGEVMIIPVLKEVFVTEKKLMLVEEWRITQTSTVNHHTETVILREEELIVNRIPAEGKK